MKRSELEKHLGKKVEIKLFNDEILIGYLMKTGEECLKNDPNLYLPRNYYFLTKDINLPMTEGCLFRVSHIKKLETSK